jgi:hypothetical protein
MPKSQENRHFQNFQSDVRGHEGGGEADVTNESSSFEQSTLIHSAQRSERSGKAVH